MQLRSLLKSLRAVLLLIGVAIITSGSGGGNPGLSCGGGDDDTTYEEVKQPNAALGKRCDEQTPCPTGLVCMGARGCDIEQPCTTTDDCPSNGYCATLNDGEQACLSLCDGNLGCENLNSNTPLCLPAPRNVDVKVCSALQEM